MKTWRCTRRTKTRVCRHDNPSRKKKCEVCGKPKPKKRRPAHMAALDYPLSWYLKRYGARCGICGAEHRRLNRDHDHETRLPRGILCWLCNSRLENFMTKDDGRWLEDALAYVRRETERKA